ncbi:MAG TPA: hypothetical protein VGR71_07555, partial [Nitrospira sp.]|nr:hypothetical protein [Nitrospira sp.]
VPAKNSSTPEVASDHDIGQSTEVDPPAGGTQAGAADQRLLNEMQARHEVAQLPQATDGLERPGTFDTGLPHPQRPEYGVEERIGDNWNSLNSPRDGVVRERLAETYGLDTSRPIEEQLGSLTTEQKVDLSVDLERQGLTSLNRRVDGGDLIEIDTREFASRSKDPSYRMSQASEDANLILQARGYGLEGEMNPAFTETKQYQDMLKNLQDRYSDPGFRDLMDRGVVRLTHFEQGETLSPLANVDERALIRKLAGDASEEDLSAVSRMTERTPGRPDPELQQLIGEHSMRQAGADGPTMAVPENAPRQMESVECPVGRRMGDTEAGQPDAVHGNENRVVDHAGANEPGTTSGGTHEESTAGARESRPQAETETAAKETDASRGSDSEAQSPAQEHPERSAPEESGTADEGQPTRRADGEGASPAEDRVQRSQEETQGVPAEESSSSLREDEGADPRVGQSPAEHTGTETQEPPHESGAPSRTEGPFEEAPPSERSSQSAVDHPHGFSDSEFRDLRGESEVGDAAARQQAADRVAQQHGYANVGEMQADMDARQAGREAEMERDLRTLNDPHRADAPQIQPIRTETNESASQLMSRLEREQSLGGTPYDPSVAEINIKTAQQQLEQLADGNWRAAGLENPPNAQQVNRLFNQYQDGIHSMEEGRDLIGAEDFWSRMPAEQANYLRQEVENFNPATRQEWLDSINTGHTFNPELTPEGPPARTFDPAEPRFHNFDPERPSESLSTEGRPAGEEDVPNWGEQHAPEWTEGNPDEPNPPARNDVERSTPEAPSPQAPDEEHTPATRRGEESSSPSEGENAQAQEAGHSPNDGQPHAPKATEQIGPPEERPARSAEHEQTAPEAGGATASPESTARSEQASEEPSEAQPTPEAGADCGASGIPSEDMGSTGGAPSRAGGEDPNEISRDDFHRTVGPNPPEGTIATGERVTPSKWDYMKENATQATSPAETLKGDTYQHEMELIKAEDRAEQKLRDMFQPLVRNLKNDQCTFGTEATVKTFDTGVRHIVDPTAPAAARNRPTMENLFSGTYESLGDNNATAMRQITDYLRDQGPGSQVLIKVREIGVLQDDHGADIVVLDGVAVIGPTGGHSFSAVNIDGFVKFVDISRPDLIVPSGVLETAPYVDWGMMKI